MLAMKNIGRERILVPAALLAFVAFGFYGVLLSYDITIYFDDASALTRGEMPVRVIAMAYPLFAHLLFAGTYLLSNGTRNSFALSFIALQFLVATAVFGLVFVFTRGARVSPTRSLQLLSFLIFPLAGLVLGRFDMFPTAAAFAALLCFSRKEYAASFALLALGAGLKLFPALLFPVFAIAYLARRDAASLARDLLPACLVAIAYVLLWAGMFSGWGDPFLPIAYNSMRTVQIESTYASAILPVYLAGLIPVEVRDIEYAMTLRFPGEPLVSSASMFVLIFAVGIAYATAFRRRGELEGTALAACCLFVLLSFVLGSKVFSPQYLLWLAPFTAVVYCGERKMEAMLAIAAAWLTGAIYPWLYGPLVNLSAFAILLLFARNILLILLWFSLLAELWRGGRWRTAKT